jgi:hypothetical protein
LPHSRVLRLRRFLPKPNHLPTPPSSRAETARSRALCPQPPGAPREELIAQIQPIKDSPTSPRGWVRYGLIKLSICAIIALPICAADWPQYRGQQRNGHSAETGLLREWPQEGPKLLWQVKGSPGVLVTLVSNGCVFSPSV